MKLPDMRLVHSPESMIEIIRSRTAAGLPLGNDEFLTSVERLLGRTLRSISHHTWLPGIENGVADIECQVPGQNRVHSNGHCGRHHESILEHSQVKGGRGG